ncbi:MAG TPA: hypothetical protein VH834_18560 [Solirubrobacteraceae bacterium]|jgi:hypothetical protein
MSTMETENGSTAQYVPFTPFQESYAFEAQPAPAALLEQLDSPAAVTTPFVSEYEGVETRSPETAELHDLLFELYDETFDETLAELAHEAWEAVTQRAEPLGEIGATASAEQFLQEWSEPVRREADTMLENIAQAVTEHDVASMSEAELDRFFDQFEPRGTGLEPYFENFLTGLWNKAKSIASKGFDVLQKGIALIPGIGNLIAKLKELVKPLLQRVLNTAIDKLPPTLQPVARQLAQRVLGAGGLEVEAEDFTAAPTAPDLSAVQRQFDLEAAALMFAADETDREVTVNEAVAGADREAGSGVAELQDARDRFVDRLEAGESPEQAMEQFIPAIMAVLPIARTVIGVIGRQRVVNTLANFLAALVKRYVPQEAATQLSRAIVDTGLRMLKLETGDEAPAQEQGTRLAYETIAQTVEDTVRRVSELDEATFEQPALLEAAVTEAFHEAAAENFPPQMLLPELHEAPLRATWVAMPTGRRRKYYKKYSHVFDVEITPQIAGALKTFGGATLAAYLKDRLGVTLPVRARVHLYQAIPGTTLRRIARFERASAGLGGAIHLHPLTVQAAGTLLQHPRLGRDVPGAFRSSRDAIAVGARFYLLEIPGARPVVVTGPTGRAAIRRTSAANVTLDFPKDEFRVFVYLSEAAAQEIASKIRTHDVTAVLLLAKRVYEAGVNVALGGEIHRHVKVLSETAGENRFLGRLPGELRQRLIRKVVDWVGGALAEYLKAGAGELVAATEDPADGVTIVVSIAHPPGAPLVRRLLAGEGIGAGALADLGSLFKGEPKLAVKSVAGYRFD